MKHNKQALQKLMNEKKILGILMKQNQNREIAWFLYLKLPDYLVFLNKLGGGGGGCHPSPSPPPHLMRLWQCN